MFLHTLECLCCRSMSQDKSDRSISGRDPAPRYPSSPFLWFLPHLGWRRHALLPRRLPCLPRTHGCGEGPGHNLGHLGNPGWFRDASCSCKVSYSCVTKHGMTGILLNNVPRSKLVNQKFICRHQKSTCVDGSTIYIVGSPGNSGNVLAYYTDTGIATTYGPFSGDIQPNYGRSCVVIDRKDGRRGILAVAAFVQGISTTVMFIPINQPGGEPQVYMHCLIISAYNL